MGVKVFFFYKTLKRNRDRKRHHAKAAELSSWGPRTMRDLGSSIWKAWFAFLCLEILQDPGQWSHLNLGRWGEVCPTGHLKHWLFVLVFTVLTEEQIKDVLPYSILRDWRDVGLAPGEASRHLSKYYLCLFQSNNLPLYKLHSLFPNSAQIMCFLS